MMSRINPNMSQESSDLQNFKIQGFQKGSIEVKKTPLFDQLDHNMLLEPSSPQKQLGPYRYHFNARIIDYDVQDQYITVSRQIYETANSVQYLEIFKNKLQGQLQQIQVKLEAHIKSQQILDQIYKQINLNVERVQKKDQKCEKSQQDKQKEKEEEKKKIQNQQKMWDQKNQAIDIVREFILKKNEQNNKKINVLNYKQQKEQQRKKQLQRQNLVIQNEIKQVKMQKGWEIGDEQLIQLKKYNEKIEAKIEQMKEYFKKHEEKNNNEKE